jgi:hypothetical protein
MLRPRKEKMASKKRNADPSASGSQEPESFEATARRTLDGALALYSAKRSLATGEIREGVMCLVAHAKARGIKVEHLIIELKHVCQSADSVAPHKSEVVSTLVTMCIREFYGAEPEPLDD